MTNSVKIREREIQTVSSGDEMTVRCVRERELKKNKLTLIIDLTVAINLKD